MIVRCIRGMLLGPPGVGKGTYTSILSQRLHLPILATGDLIRTEIAKDTRIGRKIATFASSGALVPDDLVFALMDRRISDVVREGQGFILDGFPRNLDQAKRFQTISPLDIVLNLSMEPWMLTAKLLGRRSCAACGKGFNVADVIDPAKGVHMPALLPLDGSTTTCDCGSPLTMREDDTEDVILQRLEVYEKETLPLVEFYRELGVLQSVEIKRGLEDVPKMLDAFGVVDSLVDV